MFITIKSKYTELSDSEILLKYRKLQKKKYISEIFNRYSHLSYGVCMKYLKKDCDCKDVVIKVFERLIDYGKKQEIKNIKSWLYVVTKNECLRIIEKNKRINMDYNFNNITVEEFEEKLIDDDTLINAISMLKNEQKLCIEQFYFEELSYKEISDKFGIEIKKVKSYIQNGKRNLHIILTSKNSNINYHEVV